MVLRGFKDRPGSCCSLVANAYGFGPGAGGMVRPGRLDVVAALRHFSPAGAGLEVRRGSGRAHHEFPRDSHIPEPRLVRALEPRL